MQKIDSNSARILHQNIEYGNQADLVTRPLQAPFGDMYSDYSDYCNVKNNQTEKEYSGDLPSISDNSIKNTRISRLRLEREVIPRAALISGKYLPAALIAQLMNKHKKRVILLAAGLGLGKSTAAAAIMRENFGGVGVAISHRVKLTSQLSGAFDAESYGAIKKLDSGQQVERLATTIQSTQFMINSPFCSNAFDNVSKLPARQ